MRTTLTLEDDLARKLRDRAFQEGRSFKSVTNAVLRAGLKAMDSGAGEDKRLVIQARRRGFRPGVDPARLNQLVDELQIAEFESQAAREPQ